MSKETDVRVADAAVYFLPVETRVPLKFGPETTTHVVCARVCMRVKDVKGNEAEGWGVTPLAVAWTWPSSISYEERNEAMQAFTLRLAEAWRGCEASGHPIEIGHGFWQEELDDLLEAFNAGERAGKEPMPHLSGLVCLSAFDIALHDAYGVLHDVPVYETYNAQYMNRDLSAYVTPAEGADVSFEGKYPEDFFVSDVPTEMPAWHLIGGKDLLEASELTG